MLLKTQSLMFMFCSLQLQLQTHTVLVCVCVCVELTEWPTCCWFFSDSAVSTETSSFSLRTRSSLEIECEYMSVWMRVCVYERERTRSSLEIESVGVST